MIVWLPLIRTGTGSEVYTRLLADGMRARGHQVHLDAVDHRFQFAPWLAPIRPPAGAEVVLANSWSAAGFRRGGLPLVSVCHLVVHDPVLTPYKSLSQRLFHAGFVRPMERAAVRKASINLAVSAAVAGQMRVHLDAGPVEVIHNGVDTEYFSPGDKRSDIGPVRLLFVGKPSLRKGFDILAKVVERLGPEAEFICVGPEPGPDLPRPPGTYVGPRNRREVRDAMRKADMLIFPSRMEGCPYVVAEALATGLPVIGCSGTPVEEITPRTAGIFRRAEDIDGFVDEIRGLVGDRSRLTEAREAARAHAVATLSIDTWLDRTEAVLTRAASA